MDVWSICLFSQGKASPLKATEFSTSLFDFGSPRTERENDEIFAGWESARSGCGGWAGILASTNRSEGTTTDISPKQPDMKRKTRHSTLKAVSAAVKVAKCRRRNPLYPALVCWLDYSEHLRTTQISRRWGLYIYTFLGNIHWAPLGALALVWSLPCAGQTAPASVGKQRSESILQSAWWKYE
ncbi:hypothetical protein I7I51_04642 [Histoplasma capsulatum]|uniref:Uncharacterized protein n=1 Tax=Ajellomyces capsulatus TaxID=5037 RepID=A0A8A1M075_AJECA|nr:hypothetical protein I7I51_04642 [Histoplasma capsulatum]